MWIKIVQFDNYIFISIFFLTGVLCWTQKYVAYRTAASKELGGYWEMTRGTQGGGARGLPTKGRTRSQSEHVCVWIVHHIHNGHDRPKNEGSEEHAQNHSFSYLSRVQIDKTLSRCINVPIVLCYSIIKQPVQAELKCWGMSLPNKHTTDFSSWRQTSLEKSCQLFSGFLPLGCA